ncbi:MAG: hypothetical protein BYD32DRAFT_409549 [Podila humilis]|nr:MAG: hypothetical protein BYD32DRAFT_409549 [Podila humilis]
MSDSRSLGTSMAAGPPSSAHTVFSNIPSSTINSAAYSSMSDSRSLGMSMEARPPSSANALSSVPSSTNSAYSSMGSRNSTGYSPPPGSNSKSEHSTGPDSTFVASSSYSTALTDPSSTNSAMASTVNSTGFP